MTQGKIGLPGDDSTLTTAFPRVTYDTWHGQVERALKGGDFTRRLVTRTLEGIDLQPLYTSHDWPVADRAGFAGAPPYRRGGLAIGRYAERWDMRPRYEQPDPALLKRELADDLARGARSLWLRFDRAVRGGIAPAEAPKLAAERGVPCVHAAQLGELLGAVPLDRVAVSLDAGGNALAMASCFIAVLHQRGLALAETEAWFNADPLAALARDGALPGSLSSARTELQALAAFTAEAAPRFRSVTVSSLPYHDAGADAATELGLSLASAVTYLRWLTDAGLSVAQASSQIAFSVAVGPEFFMEVAKLRALRQCWSQIVAACGGDAGAQRCLIHASSSDRSKTARDPWVNLLRETTETFAAAVGGADALTSGGFDRILGTSDAFARRIAGNLHVILDEESHVARVADPAGGAYYVETLTDQLAQAAWQRLQAIEAAGGMQAALLSGQVAAEIATTARARDARIAKREQSITGVNEFAQPEEKLPVRAEPDWSSIERARSTALSGARRDVAQLQGLRAARSGSAGWVKAAVEIARSGVDLGSLSAALHDDEPRAQLQALPVRRHARAYERLRAASDAASARGQRPSVFLCNLGPVAQHKPRAQFAAGFFNAGGLAVYDNDGFETPEAAAEAFARSGAELCAICGTDEAYGQTVERYAPALAARGAKRIILAGKPREHEARYRAAGVSDFIFLGCDVVETLSSLLPSTGVSA